MDSCWYLSLEFFNQSHVFLLGSFFVFALDGIPSVPFRFALQVKHAGSAGGVVANSGFYKRKRNLNRAIVINVKELTFEQAIELKQDVVRGFLAQILDFFGSFIEFRLRHVRDEKVTVEHGCISESEWSISEETGEVQGSSVSKIKLDEVECRKEKEEASSIRSIWSSSGEAYPSFVRWLKSTSSWRMTVRSLVLGSIRLFPAYSTEFILLPDRTQNPTSTMNASTRKKGWKTQLEFLSRRYMMKRRSSDDRDEGSCPVLVSDGFLSSSLNATKGWSRF